MCRLGRIWRSLAATLCVLGLCLETFAGPLNIINMEGMSLVPRTRADYGFHHHYMSMDGPTDHLKRDKMEKGVTLDLTAVDADTNSIISATTNTIHHHRSGCRYKAAVYASGDSVPTDESCLFCACKGSVVVCKLRICPDVPDPPPPGCIVVQKANKCCYQLVCHDNQLRKLSREQRLSTETNGTDMLPSTALQSLDQGNYCVHEGTVYAEGSAMRSSTLCEHCFCVHGKMKCIRPQCLIPLDGCKPRFRSYACCPTNYDCNDSNRTAILKTVPVSTPIPNFLKGCTIAGRYVAEGEPILPMQLAYEHQQQFNNSLASHEVTRCQTCFCMGGVVHCRPLACDRPIEGCTPIIEEGHCCPERYECDKLTETSPPDPEEVTTVTYSMDGLMEEGEETDVPTTTSTTKKALSTSYSTESTSTLGPFSTQVYEIRFEKVPLLKARKDDRRREGGSPQNSFTLKTNRLRGTGGGSREQRRKNGGELQAFVPRSFVDLEDDEKDDLSSADSNSSGKSEEQPTLVFFDEKTEDSTAIVGVGQSETDDTESRRNTEQPPTADTEEVTMEEPGSLEGADVQTLASVALVDLTNATTIQSPRLEDENNDPASEEFLPLTLTDDLKLEIASFPPKIKYEELDMPEPSNSSSISVVSSTSPAPALLTSTTVTSTPPYEDRNKTRKTSSEKDEDSVSLLSFKVEDAVASSTLNETTHDTTTDHSLVEAEDGKKSTGIPDPHVATDSSPGHRQNSMSNSPVQTSLYNNGYYGHQVEDTDNDSGDEELLITQAEMEVPHVHNSDESSSSISPSTSNPTTPAPTTLFTTSTPGSKKSNGKKKTSSHRTTAMPSLSQTTLENGDRRFVPSFFPLQHSPAAAVVVASQNKTEANPSRTWSKFGIQDSPVYRYVHPNPNTVGRHAIEGHNLFVPLPETLVVNPPQESATINQLLDRKVSSLVDNPASRLRYNPYQPPQFVDPSLVNYDEEEEDEDEDEEGDVGTVDFGSFEKYFRPPQQFDQFKPNVPTGFSDHPIGQNYDIHPFPQGHAPPNNRPLYIHPPPPQTSPSIPMISSGGTHVSLSSKDKKPKRPAENTKIINSKPLKRPKPNGDDRTLDPADNPLGFKPVVALPFTIPKSQDKFNLGLKLSGCNIYGKMYNIGQAIQELSGVCIECKCTDIGVQCAELQC